MALAKGGRLEEARDALAATLEVRRFDSLNQRALPSPHACTAVDTHTHTHTHTHSKIAAAGLRGGLRRVLPSGGGGAQVAGLGARLPPFNLKLL